MVTYVLTNGSRPLSYFYPNGNGDVADIIGFSWKSYFIFDSKEDAEKDKRTMLRNLSNRQEEIRNDTYKKVYSIIKNLKIEWLTKG